MPNENSRELIEKLFLLFCIASLFILSWITDSFLYFFGNWIFGFVFCFVLFLSSVYFIWFRISWGLPWLVNALLFEFVIGTVLYFKTMKRYIHIDTQPWSPLC